MGVKRIGVLSEDSLIYNGYIGRGREKIDAKVYFNNGIEINIISQRFAYKYNLPLLKNTNLPNPEQINSRSIYYYRAYRLRYYLEDLQGNARESESIFYIINKEGADLVLSIPSLRVEGIKIDYEALTQRFGFELKGFKIIKP